MSIFGSAHCFASEVLPVAVVWPKYTATFSVDWELNEYPEDVLDSAEETGKEVEESRRVETGEDVSESVTSDVVWRKELRSAKNTPPWIDEVDSTVLDELALSKVILTVKSSSIVVVNSSIVVK